MNNACRHLCAILKCVHSSHSILDDIEMYEQQEPFQLSDYTGLSYFLNNFLFKTIQDNIFGKTTETEPQRKDLGHFK